MRAKKVNIYRSLPLLHSAYSVTPIYLAVLPCLLSPLSGISARCTYPHLASPSAKKERFWNFTASNILIKRETAKKFEISLFELGKKRILFVPCILAICMYRIHISHCICRCIHIPHSTYGKSRFVFDHKLVSSFSRCQKARYTIRQRKMHLTSV